jgi:hypothetical protein
MVFPPIGFLLDSILFESRRCFFQSFPCSISSWMNNSQFHASIWTTTFCVRLLAHFPSAREAGKNLPEFCHAPMFKGV